jgi:hypothetical protein
VSTPLDTSQSQHGNVLDWPDMPHPASAFEEAEYLLWSYTGPKSVFFFPPGSIEEHLLIEHGSTPWRSGGTQELRRLRQKPASI